MNTENRSATSSVGKSIAASASRAEVTLAPLFCDHAVIQQGKAIPVWGQAAPGETVTVSFLGQHAIATADQAGHWAVRLAPAVATAIGTTLVAQGRTTVVIHDVVVGEVWLCSGQSNMEYTVDFPKRPFFRDFPNHTRLQVKNAAQEVAAANHPLIRHFKVQQQVADEPAVTVQGSWAICSPATVAEFTAVGYFFARDITLQLGVPVGLINATWGGTPVESWMSPDALASDPAFSVVQERWHKLLSPFSFPNPAAFQAANTRWHNGFLAAQRVGGATLVEAIAQRPHGPSDPWTPAGLYNGMIHPLIPYSLRGVLWYQGENNAERHREYHALFAAMITGWRTHFGQGDFPFYWVQLANFNVLNDPTDETWPRLREAQAQTLRLAGTGQAVAIDLGDPKNVHPANKQEVGRRLALIAKANVYGIPCAFSGPVLANVTQEGAALRIHFKFADQGLTATGQILLGFEVAGVDRKFRLAVAVIAGDTVVARSPEVAAPIAVRYAWHNAPEANLFNGAGLPAMPFRSDDW